MSAVHMFPFKYQPRISVFIPPYFCRNEHFMKLHFMTAIKPIKTISATQKSDYSRLMTQFSQYNREQGTLVHVALRNELLFD